MVPSRKQREFCEDTKKVVGRTFSSIPDKSENGKLNLSIEFLPYGLKKSFF